MKGSDYSIEHFEMMANVARYLKSIEVRLLETEYAPQHFGMWSLVFQIKGQNYRIFYDGRDFVVSLQTDVGVSAPFKNTWGKDLLVVPVEEMASDALQNAVEMLVQKAIEHKLNHFTFGG